MNWKPGIKECISFLGTSMGPTNSALKKILIAFDGDNITYSSPDRHKEFMKKVTSGPLRDSHNFAKDMQSGITIFSARIPFDGE